MSTIAPLPYPSCYTRALRKQAICFLKNKNAQRHASLASYLPAYLLSSTFSPPASSIDVAIPLELDLRAVAASAKPQGPTRHYSTGKTRDPPSGRWAKVIPAPPRRPTTVSANDKTYMRIVDKQVAAALLARIHGVAPGRRAAYLLYDTLRIAARGGAPAAAGGYSELQAAVWAACARFFAENGYLRARESVARAARARSMTVEQVVDTIASAEEMATPEQEDGVDGRVPFAELVEWSGEEARVELGERVQAVVGGFLERVGGL